MKYIIMPIIKLIWAIIFTVICLIVSAMVWLSHFIWTLKPEWPCSDGPLEMNTNDYWGKSRHSKYHKPELVYKTPFHWAFNGRFDDFK